VRQRGLFWLGFVFISTLAILQRTYYLNSFPLSYDEGIHLVWIRLLDAGYTPYRQVYITYPPLYHLSLQTIWAIWPTESAQRWFSVVYTIFGAFGTALIARQIATQQAGLWAMALMLASPILMEPSRAVMGEFHAIAWSIWAIWFALQYHQTNLVKQQRFYLLLSGLALSISLLIKLFTPFVIPLIFLIIVTHQSRNSISAIIFDILLWSLALIIPAIFLLLIIFDTEPLLEQVVVQRFLARAAYAVDASTLPTLSEYLTNLWDDDAPLLILASIGFVLVWRFYNPHIRWLMAWLGLATLFLTLHSPLWYKHFLVLMPIFAIFASIALVKVMECPQRQKIIGLILIVGLYLWHIPPTLTRWEKLAQTPQPPPDEAEMIDFIQQITKPNDCIITDDMPLLYWSGRLTPPELAEMSANRLISGFLDVETLIKISDRDDCQVVAGVANRLPKYLPDYMTWVNHKYLGRIRIDEDDLFFAKVDTNPQPITPMKADFTDHIVFHGYTFPKQVITPNSDVPLTFYWQTQQTLSDNYTIFVQLRDDQGTTLSSADYQPYKNLVPISTWPSGATIQTTTWLSIPADIPPANYFVYVGLYQPDTFERLPLNNDTSGENALILGPLVIN